MILFPFYQNVCPHGNNRIGECWGGSINS